MGNIIIPTQEELNKLRSLPLQDVMSKNGHTPVRKSENCYMYNCPMPTHEDTDASFSVELSPGLNQVYGSIPLAMFRCFGCDSIHGMGAIDLQACLLGYNPHKPGGLTAGELKTVVEKLSSLFNITIGGKAPNEWIYRWAWVDAQEEFSYTPMEWNDSLLEALGCKGVFVANKIPNEDGTYNIQRRKRYPWTHGLGEELDFNEITRLFGIEPVKEFVTPAKEDSMGVRRSRKFHSTDAYPVFVIKTIDTEGHWRVKKYEPYAQKAEDGSCYKWAWYYQGNRNLASLYEKMLYGDCDVLDALYNLDVIPTDSSIDGSHPTVTVPGRDKEGNLVSRIKFKRVCICSGPRDAMNVYFHSDCHVLYPNSESARIEPSMMLRLKEIAQDVYLLYDIDNAGVTRSREINMEHLWVRNIELPESLGNIRDPRTGKACNDVTDYFTRYTAMLGYGIDYDFEQLLCSTCSCQFWQRDRKQTRDEAAMGQFHFRFSLIVDNMLKFLFYSGLAIHRESNGSTRFVSIKEHLVETITDKEVVVKARKTMKDWLSVHSYWASAELNNVISTGKMVNREVLAELRQVELNFKPWTADVEWLFFSNGALKVTATERTLVPYSQIDFWVNKAAIVPIIYEPFENSFEISDNEMLEEYERKHRERLDEIAPGDARSRRNEEVRWNEEKNLWSMKVDFSRPMNQQGIALQYLYDTCRMFWREELSNKLRGRARDKWLSPEKQQLQDMEFISKCIAIGYLLSRERVYHEPRMVFCVDYSVADESKASGRSGKSILGMMMCFVRQVYTTGGKDLKISGETFARNFKSLDVLVHGIININDPNSNLKPEMLYNVAEGDVRKKNMFQDEEDLPADMVPKLLLSSNKMFDTSEASTNGRLWTLHFADYYHVSNNMELDDWNPAMKFGETIKVGAMSTVESQRTVAFLVQCLQFYLHFRRYVPAPVGTGGRRRELMANRNLKDKDFPTFMDSILKDETLMGVPIPKRDLVALYMQFKGRPTTKSAVESYSHGREFGVMLDLYCDYEQIQINPDIVFSNATERKRNEIKCSAYTYTLYDDKPMVEEDRQRCSLVPCLLFYKKGSEPKTFEDVTRYHATDPAIEGYTSHGIEEDD